jgi:hypothetical protein
MYGHWVKKGDNQNRAALFEHVPRDDWKNLSVSEKINKSSILGCTEVMIKAV